MDKYELVIDIIEHPERYSSKDLEEIFSDPDTRNIYDVLCKADSAVEAQVEVDVEAEWKSFARKTAFRRGGNLMRGNRAASIAAIIFTSIVAVAAGIAVTVGVSDHGNKSQSPVMNAETPMAIASEEKIIETDSVTVRNGVETKILLFENEPLTTIMDHIAEIYDVKVEFGNEDVAGLHLYYTLDPSLTLEEVVDQLNNFESIDITYNGNTLIID